MLLPALVHVAQLSLSQAPPAHSVPVPAPLAAVTVALLLKHQHAAPGSLAAPAAATAGMALLQCWPC